MNINYSLVIIGIACICASVHSQVLPIGFTCVPIGQCPGVVNPATIDIRIVTPTVNTTVPPANPCPTGQILCSAALFCGRRNITNVNPADGFATPGAFPWQAYLVNATGYAGSGVLMGPYTVVTVAHKVYLNAATPQAISVYLGVSDPRQLGTARIPSSIVVHPMFNPATLFNDIAVIRFPAASPVLPLPTPTIVPACFPAANQTFVGQSCIVSGWGQTAFTVNDAPTTQLKQVTVSIVPYTTCLASMSQPALLGTNVNMFLDPIGELCAGGEAGKDACTQDGGSPLVCSVNGLYTVAGLVAWGKGCGQAGVFGVYVNFTNYIPWMNSVFQMQGYG